MSRLGMVSEADAKGKTKELYQGIQSKFGKVHNTFKVMGKNPGFLQAMLGLNASSGKGLDEKTKELIKIAVSAVNNCQYCLDAHFAVAKTVGCTDEEIHAAIECAVAMAAFNIFNHGAEPDNDFTP
jgi:AhpD family alkylhydroperoxidase